MALQELDAYQEQARQRRGEKFKVDINFNQKVFPARKELDAAFAPFKIIQEAYLTAFKYIDEVKSIRQLHQRALSLPVEEADLLMRYQTSWERRLSTLIGEFMQLQRVRLLSNN